MLLKEDAALFKKEEKKQNKKRQPHVARDEAPLIRIGCTSYSAGTPSHNAK